MNPRIFAAIVFLGYDYLCMFNIPFIISVALCTSSLVVKAVGGLSFGKTKGKVV